MAQPSRTRKYSRTVRFTVGHWQVPLYFPNFLLQRPQTCSRALGAAVASHAQHFSLSYENFPIYIYWKSARFSSASPPLTVISIQEALLYNTLNSLARTTTLNLHS